MNLQIHHGMMAITGTTRAVKDFPIQGHIHKVILGVHDVVLQIRSSQGQTKVKLPKVIDPRPKLDLADLLVVGKVGDINGTCAVDNKGDHPSHVSIVLNGDLTASDVHKSINAVSGSKEKYNKLSQPSKVHGHKVVSARCIDPHKPPQVQELMRIHTSCREVCYFFLSSEQVTKTVGH